jgi:hypothetical protein
VSGEGVAGAATIDGPKFDPLPVALYFIERA